MKQVILSIVISITAIVLMFQIDVRLENSNKAIIKEDKGINNTIVFETPGESSIILWLLIKDVRVPKTPEIKGTSDK